MRVIINGTFVSTDCAKVVAQNTNKAVMPIGKIIFNRDTKVLSAQIQRLLPCKPNNGFKKKIPSPTLQNEGKINSQVIIKNIDELNETNHCAGKISEIVILFGVMIKDKEVYISSAEEMDGEMMYELQLKVSEIDIEITDFVAQ